MFFASLHSLSFGAIPMIRAWTVRGLDVTCQASSGLRRNTMDIVPGPGDMLFLVRGSGGN